MGGRCGKDPAMVKPDSDDPSALLSKTSSEVSDILKHQLETFRRVASLSDASAEIHKIFGSVQTIERKFEGRCSQIYGIP